MTDRIVVIGHSAVTCLGRDMDETWSGLVAGRSGLARHASLDPERYLQDIAGIVPDFGPEYADDLAQVSKLDARSIHLAMISALQAYRDAGLERHASSIDRDRFAVVVGSALGGIDLFEAERERSAKRKSLATSPYLIPGLIINQSGGQIAQRLDLHGPSLAPANACAGGGHAIVMGALMIQADMADFALCGATESCLTPMIVNGFATMKALIGRKPTDRSATNPAEASRPFSVDRAGFVLSEGAGMLVLTRSSVAERLEIPVQAVLEGWSLNTDGYHMATPHADSIARCLRNALRHSRAEPESVDYYNAHGTSTIVNDQTETGVLKEVFGTHASRLPVGSIKGAIGHALGAASAIEASVCVRAIRDQTIPPTINYLRDPELDLDYVPNTARSARIDRVMSASFGFGGVNNALILRRSTHD